MVKANYNEEVKKKLYKYLKNTGHTQPSIEQSGDKFSKKNRDDKKFVVKVIEEPYEAIINVYGLIDKRGISSAERIDNGIAIDLKKNEYDLKDNGDLVSKTIARYYDKAKSNDEAKSNDKAKSKRGGETTDGSKTTGKPKPNSPPKKQTKKEITNNLLQTLMKRSGISINSLDVSRNNFNDYLTLKDIDPDKAWIPISDDEMSQIISNLNDDNKINEMQEQLVFIIPSDPTKLKARYIFHKGESIFKKLSPDVANKITKVENTDNDEPISGETSERKRKTNNRINTKRRQTGYTTKRGNKKSKTLKLSNPYSFSFGTVKAEIKKPITKNIIKNPLKTNTVKVSTPSIKGIKIGKMKFPRIKI